MLLAFYFPKKFHAAEKAGRVTVSQKNLKTFFVSGGLTTSEQFPSG